MLAASPRVVEEMSHFLNTQRDVIHWLIEWKPLQILQLRTNGQLRENNYIKSPLLSEDNITEALRVDLTTNSRPGGTVWLSDGPTHP